MKVKRMFQSRMSDREDFENEAWMYGEIILYQNTGDVYFVPKTDEEIGAGCAILKNLASSMRFPKKLLETAGLLRTTGDCSCVCLRYGCISRFLEKSL